MKPITHPILSIIAGFVWVIITFFIPTGKPEGLLILVLSEVRLPIPIVGFLFPAFLLALPGALIVGLWAFLRDRTRPSMAVASAALCEIGGMAIPLLYLLLLSHALY